MERWSDLALAVAVAALLAGFGGLLFFTAPSRADVQASLANEPKRGRYWAAHLWRMRLAGVILWLVAAAILLSGVIGVLTGALG